MSQPTFPRARTCTVTSGPLYRTLSRLEKLHCDLSSSCNPSPLADHAIAIAPATPGATTAASAVQGGDVEPYEPFWYREGEFSFFEIDNVKWMKWYLDRAPEGAKHDRHVHLLLRILKQVRKHTDKGPMGDTICGADIVTEEPNADTAEGRKTMLQIFIDWSPRLRYYFCLIADSIKRREKAVTWVLYPFEQLLIVALLRLCGTSAEAFLAETSNAGRARLGTRFNTKMSRRHDREDLQFLVCSYAVGGVGLNLQAQCHMVIMLDHAMTHAIGEQAIGRCYRLGQKWDVHAIQLSVGDTFDVTLANANERRSLSLIFANIDQEALAAQYHNESGVQAADDGDVIMEDMGGVEHDEFAEGLHNFYMYHNQMVHGSVLTTAQKADADQMSAQAVLCSIYGRLAGVKMDAREVLGEEVGNEDLDEEEVAEYIRQLPATKPAEVEGECAVC
jgi:hypothetical protein